MLKSIKDVYIVGPGPSSSHTIAPYKAATDFILSSKKDNLLNEGVYFLTTLYGSLALTGKGHLTDYIILKVLKDFSLENNKNKVIFDINTPISSLIHPNTMKFELYDINNNLIKKDLYFSIGGGELRKNSLEDINNKNNYIYPFSSFNEIKSYLKDNNLSINGLIDKYEEKDINIYLKGILDQMINSVDNGLKTKEDYLPGSLHLKRVAKELYKNTINIKNEGEKKEMLLTSFAYSVAEENASGKMIVTAPTCGSAGIIPSIMYYYKNILKFDDQKLINGLKVGALFALLAKENASISGAVSGCQAEIGVASAMGAAILAYLNDLSIYQIEYASEIALEHFLGLTCDPVKGYVQIPCIERNGIGVLRSEASYLYAKNIAPLRKNKVSFDDVLKAMKETGDDLNPDYKETSEGGLAKIIE